MSKRAYLSTCPALLSVWLLSAPGPIAAQLQRIEIAGEPSCDQCEITLEKITTLGRSSDSVSISVWSTVARGQDGLYYVARSFEHGSILVYDSAGRFVQTVGRKGGGPGEFTGDWNTQLAAIGDSLHVFDPGNARLTVLDGNWDLARTRPIPSGRDYETLTGGEIAIARMGTGASTVALPLHVLSQDGEVNSFGNPDNLPYTGSSAEFERGLARADRDHFWAFHNYRYEFELWTAGGQLATRLGGNPEWLTWNPDESKPPPLNPPQPFLVDVRQISPDLLVIMALIPDADWSTAAEAGGGSLSAGYLRRRRDTVIDVVNLRTGQLLARRQHDLNFTGFLDDQTVYSVVDDDEGFTYMEIWRISINRSNGGMNER